MQKVSIKEFQANIYKHLSFLPLLVTKYGQPLFCVVTYKDGLFEQLLSFKKSDESLKVATTEKSVQHIQQSDQKEQVATVVENKPLEPTTSPIPDIAISEKEKALDEIINKDLSGIPIKCESKLPNHCNLDSIGKYKFTINMPEGDKILEKYLCGMHLDKLVRDGVEIDKIE